MVIIPLHNKMCCHALNALMELRGGSGAEGGNVQIQLFGKETQQSKLLLKKPQGLVRNPRLYCSSMNIFAGIYFQHCTVKSQQKFLIQMYCSAS